MIHRVAEVVAEAGRLVQEIARAGYEVELKEDEDPVTRADREADRLLKRGLTALVDCGWLSEEIGGDPEHWLERRVWIVDPLDGTVDFIDGVPDWTISVALAVDGEVRLGVVHSPEREETYLAERGGGAWAAAGGGRPEGSFQVREGRELVVSPREMARAGARSFGQGWELRTLGSTAYRMARVAAGGASATISRTDKKEWDVAAGTLLVEEAGGRVSDRAGKRLRFNRDGALVEGLVAGAPEAWQRAVRGRGPEG